MLFFFGYKLVLLLAAAAVGIAVSLHRRTLRRADQSLAADVEALARVAPGGSPAAAITVSSSAVVEIRATALPCHLCSEVSTKVQEHAARDWGGERLRVVRVGCTACGAEREVFLRIAGPGS